MKVGILLLGMIFGLAPMTSMAKPSSHKATHHSSKSSKHRHRGRHRAAHRSQGPTQEETFEEIFPPGHKFTQEEKAEASAIGIFLQNGMWKDAYKIATRSGKQHPERWWLQAVRATAAANLDKPKNTIEAVDLALKNNQGDANRLNRTQFYVLKGNALSRLNQKSAAINVFLQGAQLSPKDPYSRAGAAWILATARDKRVRNGAQAVELATQAVKLTKEKDATILDVLAAAYAEQGDFQAAQQWEEKAIARGDSDDLAFYQRRLVSYQSGKPWREDS
jgi:tetratricopeptide (TPR) repeat protein